MSIFLLKSLMSDDLGWGNPMRSLINANIAEITGNDRLKSIRFDELIIWLDARPPPSSERKVIVVPGAMTTAHYLVVMIVNHCTLLLMRFVPQHILRNHEFYEVVNNNYQFRGHPAISSIFYAFNCYKYRLDPFIYFSC